jgi:hypothetical protein
MAQAPKTRVWQLVGGRFAPNRSSEPFGIIITPEPLDKVVVESAWSYAIRYTAKGLDIPDYPAAVQLMLQRHPSWVFISHLPQSAAYNPSFAENDTPDT